MGKKHNKALKFIYWALAIAFIFAVLAVVWLYSGTLTTAKLKVFQTVPLPMALINWQPLPMRDFLIRFDAAQKISGQQNDQQVKAAIIRELINEAEVSQLAEQRDVSVSFKQVDQEYSAISAQTDLQGQSNFGQFLQSHGLNENVFKNNLVKPQLLLNQLQIWYNSQPNLNPQVYSQANTLLGQINDGGDMAALAGLFTQDPMGKSSGGDIGFVQITDLSPELREGVSALKPGDVKIIPGLRGLYIIRLEQQTGNQLHLREILLNIYNFDSWLGGQTENFKVINLLKI